MAVKVTRQHPFKPEELDEKMEKAVEEMAAANSLSVTEKQPRKVKIAGMGVSGRVTWDEKEITIWEAQELGIDLSQSKRNNMVKLFIPESEGNCEFIEAESLEEAGEILAQKLRDEQVI